MKSLDQQLAEAKVRNELASEKLRAARLRMQQAVLRKLAGTTKNVASEGWRKGGYGGWVGRRTDRYESATRTRLRPGPAPRDGNADAHLTYMVRGSLRRACQDLERNSSIGRIVIRRAQDLIVGDGPVVTATTQDPEWNAVADRMWNRWADLEDPGMVGWCDVTRRRSLAQTLRSDRQSETTCNQRMNCKGCGRQDAAGGCERQSASPRPPCGLVRNLRRQDRSSAHTGSPDGLDQPSLIFGGQASNAHHAVQDIESEPVVTPDHRANFPP